MGIHENIRSTYRPYPNGHLLNVEIPHETTDNGKNSHEGLPSALTPFDFKPTRSGILVAEHTSPLGFRRNGKQLLIPTVEEIPPASEKTVINPLEQLQKYQERRPRLDLENKEIVSLLEGVDRFKEYNIHEQIEDNPITDAIGLGPGKFRVPNHTRFPYLFPHDLFYMSKADHDTEEGRMLVESGLDKQAELFEKFKIIPNFAAYCSLNATSLPVFIPMVWDWYQSHPDKESDEVKAKLHKYITVGAQEHVTVWNNPRDLTGAIGSYHHTLPEYKYLCRVGDRDAGYQTNAARELIMDFSSVRGAGSEDALLPICVNSILAQNKAILAKAIETLGIDSLVGRTAEEWRHEETEMKKEIRANLYNPKTGTYHDRDYEENTLREEITIASVWTLWGEVASGKEALDIVGNLARLDNGHGLLVTAIEDLQDDIPDEAFTAIGVKKRYLRAFHKLMKAGNWDANSWPPLLITMKEGIIKYAKSEDKGLTTTEKLAMVRFAITQTENEIVTQTAIFKKQKNFSEKWDRDGNDDNGHFHYPHQKNGLGWGATLAELNVKKFLPELYRLEDELAVMTGEVQPETAPVLDDLPTVNDSHVVLLTRVSHMM